MRKVIYTIGIIIGFLLCTGCRNVAPEENLPTMTTLMNAWDIAEKEAKKWADDAVVISINSTDYLDNESSQNGIDGLRRCWGFAFHSEEKEKQYHMYVVGNEIYSTQETKIAIYEAIDKIDMDSSDAYQKAVEYGMTGGEEWAFGYHYLLQYYYMNGQDNEPVLSLVVRGISSESKNEMMLYIDPYTQEIMQCIIKTGYDENGRSLWEAVDKDNENNTNVEESEVEPKKQMTREEIQEEYKIFELAKKYYMDPEELTDVFLEGLHSDRFDPFANIKSYEKDEWENLMTERYGDNWKDW